MKKSLQITIKFCIAFILLASVIWGYGSSPEHMIELTCISNFLIGLIFLFSGIRILRNKKDFPNLIYSSGLITIMLVFLVCMGSLSGMYHMNFKGAFLFLHVINPIIILIYYLLLIDEKKKGKMKSIFIMPLFAVFYLLMDYIVGTIVKQYVYGFFEPDELTIFMAFVVGIVIYVVLFLISLILYKINVLVKKKINII